MMTARRALSLLAATLALAGPAAARAAALPGPGSSEQAVAVAYLDPGIALSLDVVTGRLELSGVALGFSPAGPIWTHQRPVHPFETGVAAIYDPLSGRLYRYTGGIAGYAAAPAPRGALIVGGGTTIPVWGPPSLLRHGRQLVSVVFADGRRVTIRTDPAGRVTQLLWPGGQGQALRTTIAYAPGRTAITDPFGVRRTYAYSGEGRAYELVPAAWRGGRGYRHFITPVLDGARETGWVQYRALEPHPGSLIAGLRPFAGPGWAGVSFDSPANGGYIDLNLAQLGRAHALEAEMARRGLADVTAIRPTYASGRQIARADAFLRPRLRPMIADCHLSWGYGAGPITITVSTTLTPAERTALLAAVQGLPAWVVFEVRGASQCISVGVGHAP